MSMSGGSFTKLSESIVASTVWGYDSDTRVVWVTMLAIADATGVVRASVPGLARLAVVSVEAARKALDIFLSPDPDSRDKSNEGRRIEVIDGGWLILNYLKYRNYRDDDARRLHNREYQKKSRATPRTSASVSTRQHSSAPVSSGQQGQRLSAQEEADAEADGEAEAEKNPHNPPSQQDQLFDDNAPVAEGESAAGAPAAPDAEAIYALYPRKVGRAAALKAIEKAIASNPPQMVYERTKAYALAVQSWSEHDQQFIPHPATWYNQERFHDDPSTWERKSPNATPPGCTPIDAPFPPKHPDTSDEEYKRDCLYITQMRRMKIRSALARQHGGGNGDF